MPKKSDWKEFELLIADIQKKTAPNTEVRHDHRVKGLSGRQRQLDITLSGKIGLHPLFIVIECKKYKRPVTIDKVEAFVTKLRDVRASLGVMISHLGFDQGAIAQAQLYNVSLLTYREAQSADWNAMFGEKTWFEIISTEVQEIEALVLFVDQNQAPVSLDTQFFDGDQNPLFTVGEMLMEQIAERIHDVGYFCSCK